MRCILCIIVIALLLSACTSPEAKIGYLIGDDVLDSLVVNQTPSSAVVETIGFSPNIRSSFNEPVWYYVYEYRDRYEDLIERQVVILSFDRAGVLNAKRITGTSIGRNLIPDPSTTKVYSSSPSFLQTLFGGIF